MVHYDDLIGSILIASWLSAMLYGVVVYKIWEYLCWDPASGDSRVRKWLLLCCTASSSIGMAAQLANVYYPTVNFWGNTMAIQKQYWPGPVYVIANSLTGAMVDAYLIQRVYRLSRMLWLALFLALCVLLGLAGGFMVAATLTIAGDISSRNKVLTAGLIWTFGTAAGDILIAAALIWKLITMRTSYKSTNSLIQRLVVGAIQTGSTTSTVAIAALVAYFIGGNRSNVPTAFHSLVAPLYMLTLLYNFNLRRHRDKDASVGDSDLTATHLTRPNAIWMSRDMHLTGPDTMRLDSTRAYLPPTNDHIPRLK
ncbi:hypothetical protein DFH08DRAFT_978141 [Mycena albidolilacea]|uniref:DUF6534 domain-containing protein n=1 Tax=Mycena albidolilacea TaxID=1033008 RepID=A0AAD7E7Q5_9AGAR|nr:hypothetical protein DFH08DRAFT_978141 [Mycena albidolilacea]